MVKISERSGFFLPGRWWRLSPFLLGLLLFLFGISHAPRVVGPVPGATVPAFRVRGPAGTVSAQALRGEPAVLNFWASWCPDCRAEWPALAALARRGVRVVAIDETQTEVEPFRVNAFLTRHPGVPVYLDPAGKVGERFLVRNLPTSFFLTASGRIAAQVVGPENLDGFLSHLAAARLGRGEASAVIPRPVYVPALLPFGGVPLLVPTALAGLFLAETLTPKELRDMLDFLLLGAVLGGKLPGMLFGDGGFFLRLLGGGFSLPGALLGAAAFGAAVLCRQGRPFREATELIRPLLAGGGLALLGAGYLWPFSVGILLGGHRYQPLGAIWGAGLLLAALFGRRPSVVLGAAVFWFLVIGAVLPGSLPPVYGFLLLVLLGTVAFTAAGGPERDREAARTGS